MPSPSDSILYDEVIRVTHVYLGPAADRFIDRQIASHLNKAPSKLTQKDLTKLIDWIRVTVSLLTEDNEIVKEYIMELNKLANNKPKSKANPKKKNK